MPEKEPPVVSPLGERPDLCSEARARNLGWIEQFNLRLVRSTFEPGRIDQLLRFLQRTLGQSWIYWGTKNLTHVVGRQRLPDLQKTPSVLLVANHRSFFDLYVITALLVRAGLQQRIVFPVRARFFYDSFLGLVINFLMSFLAMYPPIFRERKKAAFNRLALDELSWLLRRGGVFAGLHPEGARKTDDDPYSFLEPQPGIGRIVFRSRVPVIPAFINGLGNDIARQLRGNFDGTGKSVYVVFGKPIDFGSLLDQEPSPRAYRAIAQRCMQEIARLGEEERNLRGPETDPPSRS